jgi:hypothetical protein
VAIKESHVPVARLLVVSIIIFFTVDRPGPRKKIRGSSAPASSDAFATSSYDDETPALDYEAYAHA